MDPMKVSMPLFFYNTDKFDVLDSGDFWLSETPDSVSFGWDAVCRRICTWGKFRNKETGFTFVYFNLHMDHKGIVARAESAKLILQKIKEFPEPLPVMLSGDFNVDQTNESYRLLNESGVMKMLMRQPTTVISSQAHSTATTPVKCV